MELEFLANLQDVAYSFGRISFCVSLYARVRICVSVTIVSSGRILTKMRNAKK